MNKTNEIIENLKTTVYESIGKASMCWQPIPSGVFDEKLANEVAAYLMAEIESFYVQLKSATQVKEILPTPDSSTGEPLLPEFSEYLIDEINGYTNKRDGWKERSSNYHAYDLVCRVLRQVADKYINITCKDSIKSKPDSSTGMRTAEEIIQDMIAEMPFVLATNNIPYIVEAMHIFKNQSITPKEGEGNSAEEIWEAAREGTHNDGTLEHYQYLKLMANTPHPTKRNR